MGIFGKWFKDEKDIANREIVEIPWQMLASNAQLNEVEKESENKLGVIFKHSTRCGISRMVLKRFEKDFDLPREKTKLYFLDLLNHRELSQEVASRFGVVHESPQLIAIKNGKAVHHASHHGIHAGDLKAFVE